MRRRSFPPLRGVRASRPPALVLLARRPALGRVKSRLAAEFGARTSLALYLAFLHDTLHWLQTLRREGWSIRVEWSKPYRPGRLLAGKLCGMSQGCQARGSLGRRIEVALRRALACGGPWAVAIGADSPHLGPDPLRTLQRRMANRARPEVVLGPACDGGYYLIAARRVRYGWFVGVDWGGSRVLNQTMANLRRHGVRVALLPASYDLDTSASLLRLERDLRRFPSLRRRLAATRRALRHSRGGPIVGRRDT